MMQAAAMTYKMIFEILPMVLFLMCFLKSADYEYVVYHIASAIPFLQENKGGMHQVEESCQSLAFIGTGDNTGNNHRGTSCQQHEADGAIEICTVMVHFGAGFISPADHFCFFVFLTCYIKTGESAEHHQQAQYNKNKSTRWRD